MPASSLQKPRIKGHSPLLSTLLFLPLFSLGPGPLPSSALWAGCIILMFPDSQELAWRVGSAPGILAGYRAWMDLHVSCSPLVPNPFPWADGKRWDSLMHRGLLLGEWASTHPVFHALFYIPQTALQCLSWSQGASSMEGNICVTVEG